MSAATFLVLAYVAGLVLTFKYGGFWVDFNVAQYLNIPHTEGRVSSPSSAPPWSAPASASSGTTRFPASVFMGDVGSLALGGALGFIAVLTKNEFLSVIVDGVFVVETLSVIIQVASFKLTGKRVFRMAPIHHHFELKGWAEPKVIVRFWIVAIVLALVGLVSLKLR